MTIGRLAVLALAAVLAIGGFGTAFAALSGGGDDDPSAQAIELRKDDAAAELVSDDDEGDGDHTRGDDGTGGLQLGHLGERASHWWPNGVDRRRPDQPNKTGGRFSAGVDVNDMDASVGGLLQW